MSVHVPGYTQTKTWTAPNHTARQLQERLNAARQRFCKKSIAWTHNLNRGQHRQDFKQDWYNHQAKQMDREFRREQAERAVREAYGIPVTRAPKEPSLLIDKLLDAVEEQNHTFAYGFDNNLSLVLSLPTAFSLGYHRSRFDPNWELGMRPKPEPKYPGLAEMKYEGDERIATDMLHRRFLGAPRVPGNDTVNWTQAAIVPQYPLDDTRLYYHDAVHRLSSTHERIIIEDLMFRTHEWDGRPCAGELAVTDEGVQLLDTALLECLDD